MKDVSRFGALPSSLSDGLIPLDTGGATCRTYLIYYEGRKCFLKRLREEYEGNPRYVQAFLKEYEIGRQLNHPNLVKYIAYEDDNILMEYIEGDTLTDFIRKNPDYFAHKEHCSRFQQEVFSALQYMHRNQVLHLDLKPDNIMMTHTGKSVKIIDLGFSYSDGFDTTAGYSEPFAAPEQKEGKALGEHADIYAVGKILEYIQQQAPKSAFSKSLIQRLTVQEGGFQSVEEVETYIRNKRKRRKALFTSAALVALTALCILLFLRPFSSPYTEEQQDSIYFESLFKEGHPGAIAPKDAPHGVYVVDWNGNLVKPDNWKAEYRPLAVGLITDSVRARIALADVGGMQVFGPDGLAEGLVHTLDSLPHDTMGEAEFDYQGKRNTRVFTWSMMKMEDCAMTSAAEYQFADGEPGYLPGMGELLDMQKHVDEVEHALKVCGGRPLAHQYWSSTQDYTYFRIWTMKPHDPTYHFANLRNSGSPYAAEYGTPKLFTRPFGSLD